MSNSADLRLTYARFDNGERYPILLKPDGLPVWYPTLFVTVRYRNASKAFGTGYAALSAIRHVLRWAKAERIDLVERFKRRQFLQVNELELLASFLRRRLDDKKSQIAIVTFRPGKLESVRARAPRPAQIISAGLWYSRLSYAAEYLDWLGFRVLEEAANQIDDEATKRIEKMAEGLRSRRPRMGRNSGLAARRAQSRDEEAALLKIANPDHVSNPFTDATARRNFLIVMMLDELGLRAGELLAIKVPDIDFQAQEVVVRRRHNDGEDPRRNQPVVKTLDRRLAMSDELTLMLTDYVLKERRMYTRANRHPMLLVATRRSRAGHAGEPLSRQALAKITVALSASMQEGSQRIYPHLLRHNAATRMFNQLSAQGASQARIEQLLSWKFGWADGSGTARTYTRSEAERQALEVQKRLQEKWRYSRRAESPGSGPS